MTDSQGRKRRKAGLGFMGLTSRLLMLTAGGLLCLSYFSVLVNPAKLWFLVVFGILFIPLVFLNIFLAIWSVRRRSKAVVIPLLALLPALFFLGQHVQFRSGKDIPTADEDSFRIVSYNVGRFKASKPKMDRKACRDSIALFLKSWNPDIICLQEFYLENGRDIKSFISSEFPGYHPVHFTYTGKYGRYGNLTLSKFPVRDKGTIKFEGSTNLAIYSDILVNGRKLRIYNCHLQSYNISPLKVIKKILRKDSEVLKETEERMRASIVLRPKQVGQILSSVMDSPVETIVCGDFNDTPVSYTYYKLRRGHQDSFVEAGKGFAATYVFLWPFLRIDYILHSSDYAAVRHDTPHVRYSDHYPVISVFNERRDQ